MTFKLFLKYVLLPLTVVLLLAFLVFYRPIVRYYAFEHNFDQLVKHRGMNVSVEYAHNILQLGSQAEQPLLDKARSGASNVEKYYALYLLGRLHSEKAAPEITAGLKAEDATVRLGAMRGLKYMMSPQYLPAVRGLLSDPVRDIRYEAVESLAQVNLPESIRLLHGFVSRERDQAVWARAWLSLRYLLDAHGVVQEKFRVNKNLQIVPADEINNEVGFTYFFIKVQERDQPLPKIINVPRQTWKEVRLGDTISKQAQSEVFTITPAVGETTHERPTGKPR